MSSNTSDNHASNRDPKASPPIAWPESVGKVDDPYLWRRILHERHGYSIEEAEALTEEQACDMADYYESADSEVSNQ